MNLTWNEENKHTRDSIPFEMLILIEKKSTWFGQRNPFKSSESVDVNECNLNEKGIEITLKTKQITKINAMRTVNPFENPQGKSFKSLS